MDGDWPSERNRDKELYYITLLEEKISSFKDPIGKEGKMKMTELLPLKLYPFTLSHREAHTSNVFFMSK